MRRSSLLWSPHDAETFAVGSADNLKLYRFNAGQMHVLGGVADVQQLKCMAWSPDAAQPWTLAIGTASGRVVLHDCTPASMRAAGADAATSALCEFVPRFQRVCFSAAWNPLQPQQVAAGLDKVRSDYGVLVWDVTRGAGGPRSAGAADPGGTPRSGSKAGIAPSPAASTESLRNSPGPGLNAQYSPAPTMRGAGAHARHGADFSSSLSFDLSAVGAVPSVEEPVAQLGNSEAATSIGWVGGAPSCLLVGTGFRWLRMYDLRAREASVGSPILSCHAHTKAVYGVSFDPFHEMRVVTHSDDADGVVKGWDLRALKDNTPLFTVACGGGGRGSGSASRGVLHVGWCPTRRGLLSTIVEGSNTLYLWEVDHAVARHLETSSTNEEPPAAQRRAPSVTRGLLGTGAHSASTISGTGGGAKGTGARIAAFECAYESESPATAAAWHPTDHSRMLLLLRSGTDTTLRDLSLHQAPPIAWSVRGALVHATRQQELRVLFGPSNAPATERGAKGKGSEGGEGEDEGEGKTEGEGEGEGGEDGEGEVDSDGESEAMSIGGHTDDVLTCMRRRVHRGYALDPPANLKLLERSWAAPNAVDRAQLSTAWRWVMLSSRASSSAAIKEVEVPATERSLPKGLIGGAIGILRLTSASGSGRSPGGASESTESASGLRVFRSEGRVRVMRSFGWEAFKDPSQLESAIDTLETSGEYERAALMALFQSGAHAAYNELGRAVRCLERGGAKSGEPERATALRMMAMVLAGYQPRAPLWWSTVHATAASLASPHLRLLLAVLCSPSEGHETARGAPRRRLERDYSEGSLSPHGQRSSGGEYEDSDTFPFDASPDSFMSHSPQSPQEEWRGGVSMLSAQAVTDRLVASDAKFVDGSEPFKARMRNRADSEPVPRSPDALRRAVQTDGKGNPVPGGSRGGRHGGEGVPMHGKSSVMLEQVVLDTSDSGEAAGLFSDALAMACRFLPDAQLHGLLRKLVSHATSSGSISALCLTGLSVSAVPLLQAYIDRTSDVQSAVLLASKGPPTLLQHARVQAWLTIYSNLLNSWQLYHARCTLDIAVAARIRHGELRTSATSLPSGGPSSGSLSRSMDRLGVAGAPGTTATAQTIPSHLQHLQTSQVFARCSFCSHSLVTNGGGRLRPSPSTGAPSQRTRTPKATACPRCKKPLPRCSICQQHLGCPDPAGSDAVCAPVGPNSPAVGSTPATAARVAVASENTPKDPHWQTVSSGFGHWMMWCQSCRHGGHAEHLLDWFAHHSECPVSGCNCKCAMLDKMVPVQLDDVDYE